MEFDYFNLSGICVSQNIVPAFGPHLKKKQLQMKKKQNIKIDFAGFTRKIKKIYVSVLTQKFRPCLTNMVPIVANTLFKDYKYGKDITTTLLDNQLNANY